MEYVCSFEERHTETRYYFPLGIGTCSFARKYATRSRTSSGFMRSNSPSGMIETEVCLRVAMSAVGIVIVSLTVNRHGVFRFAKDNTGHHAVVRKGEVHHLE